MPVRRNTRSGRPSGATRASSNAARQKAPARKPVAKTTDVTAYAEKPATPYHKAFAQFIVKEIGYDPEGASSKRAAFLKGVSIATAARPVFNSSDFIEEWRERTGETKRGPKPTTTTKAAPPSKRRRPDPEPVEDAEFDDEEIDEDDDDFDDEEIDEDDDDFDDEEIDEDDDDFEDEDEDEEPAPTPKRGRAAPARSSRSAAPARKPTSASARSTKSAPAKARHTRDVGPTDDDDFVF